MAAGDFKWFAQALHDLGNKIHDLDNDDLRMGIVTGVTPAVNTAAHPSAGYRPSRPAPSSS